MISKEEKIFVQKREMLFNIQVIIFLIIKLILYLIYLVKIYKSDNLCFNNYILHKFQNLLKFND